jgi:hypothetical protein
VTAAAVKESKARRDWRNENEWEGREWEERSRVDLEAVGVWECESVGAVHVRGQRG